MNFYSRIFFFTCIFFAHCIFGQNNKLDSLLRTFGNEKHDTLKVKTALKITSRYLSKGFGDSALIYARKAYELSAKNNFIKGLAGACNQIGQTYAYLGKTDSTIYYFKLSLANHRKAKNVSMEASLLNNLGVAYTTVGNIPKALDYYFQSLRIKEQLQDSESVARSCHNIAQLYSDVKDTVNTLKYHLRALQIRKNLKDTSEIGTSLIAIGVYHFAANRLEVSKKYFDEALKIAESMGEEESIAIACYNVGNVFYRQKNIEKCLELYNRSLSISRKNKNIKGVAICQEIIGDIHNEKKETEQAIQCYEEAYALSKEMEDIEITGGLCLKLSSIYEKMDMPQKALTYFKEHKILKDSLFNAANIAKLTSESLNYEHEKEKLLRQKEQEKKELIAKAESFKKNIIILVVLVFLLVVLVFSWVILNKLKENRRQKHIIEEQRNEMVASINYAKRIQYALLAHADLLKQNLPKHFVLFKPKDIVSGDFYWATFREGYFYLAVCDSTGHGVPGAFMSLVNINFLNEAVNEKHIKEPHQILNHVRHRLIESMGNGRDGMDAILVKIPEKWQNKLTIEYAAANNVPVLIKNGQLINLSKDKMPVGRGENLNSFTTYTSDVERGDSLYLYTDGFADQFGGPKGKKFMYKQLDKLLLSCCEKNLLEQKEGLARHFEDWKGKLEQVDDICVIGIRF